MFWVAFYEKFKLQSFSVSDLFGVGSQMYERKITSQTFKFCSVTFFLYVVWYEFYVFTET